MSRAYRVSVNESIRRVVCAEDHVSTQLELLDILPCDQMADLLAAELIKQGFERAGDAVVRVAGETKISVDLTSGTVTVSLATSDAVQVSGTRTGNAYDDVGTSAKQVKEQLKQQLIEQLEGNVSEQQKALQKQVTDQLEGQLADLRKELDQAANRATAQALKQKAAQIGQIKALTEDPETGSMTIIVEV